MDRNRFCGVCGTEFSDRSWPRRCPSCTTETYRNPLPVAICLQPVIDGNRIGLAIAQRAIPPRGEWALIAGHLEVFDHGSETAEEGAAREFREETGVEPGKNPRILRSEKNTLVHLLIIVETDPITLEDWQRGRPCPENLALDVMWEPRDLCFPVHTKVAREWFANNPSGRTAVIMRSTVNEFDSWCAVWLVDPIDTDDLIDVIYEDADFDRCEAWCAENAYRVVGVAQ